MKQCEAAKDCGMNYKGQWSPPLKWAVWHDEVQLQRDDWYKDK